MSRSQNTLCLYRELSDLEDSRYVIEEAELDIALGRESPALDLDELRADAAYTQREIRAIECALSFLVC